MKRLLLFVAVLFLACSPALSAPRNVLLIVTDDQGLDAGCYGNPVLKTPTLDRLASEGTRFAWGFCTTASCSPSRSVILTGLYNHANGQYGLQHSAHNFSTFAKIRSLPVLLSEAGYRTCAVGKFHVQPEQVYSFDVKHPETALPKMLQNASAFIWDTGDKPFFLYFCPTEPHRKAKGFGNPKGDAGRYDPAKVIVPPFLPDKPEVREEIADYYQAITRVDAAVGKLLDALREAGHQDDTVVMCLSDNGMPFPGAKTTLYDAGTHLPLVVRSPDQKTRGQACNAMVTWADITPTILECARAKLPAYPLHGRSFLGLLDERDPAGRDEVYGSHTFHEVTMYYPMRSVRTRQYKLIMNIASPLEYPFASDIWGSTTWQSILNGKDTMMGVRSVQAFLHRPQYELYDLQKDPNEVKNLADSPESAAVLKELQARLRAWQEKTDDPWVIKYKHE